MSPRAAPEGSEKKLAKEVRLLKAYTIVATIVCAALFTLLFAGVNRPRAFEEIDVERINIVEKTGELRMVISNQERQHPGISNGKIIERETARPPGMIFFNHLGDEMGGLIMGENGGDGHFGSLTFDKVRGDQTACPNDSDHAASTRPGLTSCSCVKGCRVCPRSRRCVRATAD